MIYFTFDPQTPNPDSYRDWGFGVRNLNIKSQIIQQHEIYQ